MVAAAVVVVVFDADGRRQPGVVGVLWRGGAKCFRRSFFVMPGSLLKNAPFEGTLLLRERDLLKSN